MDCNEFRNIVADLFDKQVDEQLRTVCEEHLCQCADCRSYYEGLRAAERMVAPSRLSPQKPTPNPSQGEGSLVTPFNAATISEANQAPLPSGGVGGGFLGGESAGRGLRIAAAFIGILLISAIAVAAVRWLKPTTPTAPASTHTETVMQESNVQADVPPVHFDDVRLDSILTVVAAHYGKTVHFASEEPKALQLIMTWQPDAPLADFIERLNMFDGLHLALQQDTIFVGLTGGNP